MSKRKSNFLALLLLLVTVSYGLFQARTLLHGPTLSIHSPSPNETVTAPLLEVSGNVENAIHISINGKPVTMDIVGSFSETLVTPQGYGVIVVEAKNRFGHSVTKRIEFMGDAPTQIL
jgi:Glucodextranase, domain B